MSSLKNPRLQSGSIKSKVNTSLRTAIITALTPGTTMTNNGIQAHVAPATSLRSIQEATQKLTREGVLASSKSGRYTWYGLNTAPTTIQQ